jgi:hypothetical protein
VGDTWQEVVLEGTEDYFTRAYMSLPYELDANSFAYERVKDICGNTDELQKLYAFWCPKDRISCGELLNLFHRIDGEVTR